MGRGDVVSFGKGWPECGAVRRLAEALRAGKGVWGLWWVELGPRAARGLGEYWFAREGRCAALCGCVELRPWGGSGEEGVGVRAVAGGGARSVGCWCGRQAGWYGRAGA